MVTTTRVLMTTTARDTATRATTTASTTTRAGARVMAHKVMARDMEVMTTVVGTIRTNRGLGITASKVSLKLRQALPAGRATRPRLLPPHPAVGATTPTSAKPYYTRLTPTTTTGTEDGSYLMCIRRPGG